MLGLRHHILGCSLLPRDCARETNTHERAHPVGLVTEDSAEVADDVDDAEYEASLAA